MSEIAFKLRTSHLEQVASILEDPEATDNDRTIAETLLRNAEVAAHGVLPFCQDTGTAIIVGKKGQEYGRVVETRRRFPGVFTMPTRSRIYGIHRRLR